VTPQQPTETSGSRRGATAGIDGGDRITPQAAFPAQAGPSRLNGDKPELWNNYFADALKKGDSEVIRVWCFGFACMLELEGPPDVVNEYLWEHDPNKLIGQYLENVRGASREVR
jgi:hypothetical protein